MASGTDETGGRSLYLYAGGAILLLGVAVVAGGMTLGDEGRDRIERAETTNGTVLAASYESGIDDYEVTIRYEYTVDGTTYESDAVYPNGERSDGVAGTKATDLVERFPAGETVTVYYLPDEPSTAFLIPDERNRADNIVIVVMGVCIGVLGIAVILGAFRRRLDQKQLSEE